MVDIPAENGQNMIVAPTIDNQKCRNCKFQKALGGPFGPAKLCTEAPPRVTVLADAFAVIPPGSNGIPLGDNVAGNFPAGGLQVVHTRNEVRYPPAFDDWTCGRWKPRLAL